MLVDICKRFLSLLLPPRKKEHTSRTLTNAVLLMKGHIMKLLLAFLIALTPINLFADELETDLNGFRLQQFVNVADSQMAPPFKTFDQGNLVVNAYQIDEEAYMVVGYQKKHPNNISSLQLTGFTAKALPFKGLMLGDS